MTKFKTRTLAIATMGLLTAACTSATAGNYAQRNIGLADKQEAFVDMEIDGEVIRIELVEAIDHALNEAELDLAEIEIEIDHEGIMHDVQQTVRNALIEAEAELREMESELKDFDGQEFHTELENMRRGLEQAVNQQHLTEEEMERMIAHMEETREKAINQARKALKDVRDSLKELSREARRGK